MDVNEPYNPLHKKNLGFSVAEALLAKDAVPLPPAKSFRGAGIYAIYYMGNFPLYAPVATENREEKFGWPLYVGKAIPEGARRGGFGLDTPAGAVLFKRLCEHAQSIEAVANLALADFACRFLTVDDIWIPLGENLLIEMFVPVWNMVIDGFGNHDPGAGRYNQRRSAWDELHVGRVWAERLQVGFGKIAIEEKVKTFFQTHPKPPGIH
jgi:hypothetical protein